MSVEMWLVLVLVLLVLVFILPSGRKRRRVGRRSNYNPRQARRARYRRSRKPKVDHHKQMQAQAESALSKFDSLTCPKQRFIFLRSVHHFAFEEMILSAYERKGYKVIRNKRYTGDGGIDGKVIINGKAVLVQAKRYSGAISKADVSQFGHVCLNNRTDGLFIHTGKTPTAVWGKISKSHPHVKVISGQRLIELFEAA